LSASWPCRRFVTHFAWLVMTVAVGVSDGAAAQLTASWTDNSSGQAAFEIERRAENEFNFSKIADVPAGSQSYVDSSVLDGVTYCYRVRAYNDTALSAYSGEACGFAATPASSEPAAILSITKAGSGNGGIFWTAKSGAGGEVLCGLDCTATFFPPSGVITLTAAPAAGSQFLGWSGGCSGTGACTLVGNTSMAVTATFSRM
jgi:Divergent InlB B-repeat domain